MSSHTTAPTGGPEAAATAVKNATTSFMKKMFGINWDTIAQGGAPTFRRKAESLAEGAKSTFPVDHWARSDAAEIVYNVMATNMKNAIETLKDGPLKTSLKEIVEFWEAFVQDFCDEKSGGHAKTKASKPIDPETAKVIADYKKATMTGIQARLDAASDADYDTASAAADKRMRDAAKMVGYMTDGVPQEEEERPKGPPLIERVNETLGEFAHAATPPLIQSEARRQAYAAETARIQEQQRLERALVATTPRKKARKFLFGF